MSLNAIFCQLSLWIVNLYLKSCTFCLYIHGWIRIRYLYGSGSTKLLNTYVSGFTTLLPTCMLCLLFGLTLQHTPCLCLQYRTMSPIIAEVYTVNTMNWRLPESVQADLRQLGHPYYIVNILLCLSFLVAKLTHPLCDYLFAPGPASHSSPFF